MNRIKHIFYSTIVLLCAVSLAQAMESKRGPINFVEIEPMEPESVAPVKPVESDSTETKAVELKMNNGLCTYKGQKITINWCCENTKGSSFYKCPADITFVKETSNGECLVAPLINGIVLVWRWNGLCYDRYEFCCCSEENIQKGIYIKDIEIKDKGDQIIVSFGIGECDVTTDLYCWDAEEKKYKQVVRV